MPAPADLVRETSTLISLPEIYWELQRLTEDPEATLTQFANVIRLDPGLVAKVLQLSNSALFGRSSRVETVIHAVNLLGTALLHDLVLTTAVVSRSARLPIAQGELKSFWQRAVFCGLLTKELAERCRLLDAERLFTHGLLHEIGHLVLLLQCPEQLKLAIDISRTEQRALHLVQLECWGYDYGAVGSALLDQWRLPIGFKEAAAFHFAPARAEHFPIETAIIHLAWHYCHLHQAGAEAAVRVPLDPTAFTATGCDVARLEAALLAADDALADVLRLFIKT